MANIGSISTGKGELFTNAHVASISRAQSGYAVLSGCDVNAAGTPDLTVIVDSGYVTLGYGLGRTTVSGGTLPISTPDATYPRIDVIYVNGSGSAAIYNGTPAVISPTSKTNFKQMASPAPGANLPTGVILALVYVPANSTAITNAYINDIATYGELSVAAPTTSVTSGYVPTWTATQRLLGTGLVVGGASGLASLNASSLVIQNPASASATPGNAVIPITGVDGKLADGFLPSSSGAGSTNPIMIQVFS